MGVDWIEVDWVRVDWVEVDWVGVDWVGFEVVFRGTGEKLSSFPPWWSFPLERGYHSSLPLTSFSYCRQLRCRFPRLVHRGHDHFRLDHLDLDQLRFRDHP